jgi:hypothetical protein
MDRWKRPPTAVHSHGGRDEYGPYLGSLELNGIAMNTVPTLIVIESEVQRSKNLRQLLPLRHLPHGGILHGVICSRQYCRNILSSNREWSVA